MSPGHLIVHLTMIVLVVPSPSQTSSRYAPGQQQLSETIEAQLHSYELRASFHDQYTFFDRAVPGQPGNSTCCGFTNAANTKIIGGTETAPNQFPWAVGLLVRGSSRPFCGGSVINNLYILTAAHCVTGRRPAELVVLLGEHDVKIVSGAEVLADVQTILLHPKYSRLLLYNDVALLRLTTPLLFDPAGARRVAPVCLPLRRRYLRHSSVAVGWGVLNPLGQLADRLNQVTLTTMSNVECALLYPLMIWPSMLCAIGSVWGGRDTCAGDSGGALVVQQGLQSMIVGVTSWGFGCAGALRPGVYARVTTVLDWIVSSTEDATYC